MTEKRDVDYLFISARVRALEMRLLNREQMEQMIEAHTNEDAMRILQDHGYPEEDEVNVNTVNDMLAAVREDTLKDFQMFAPDPRFIDVFKCKYDYHNAKVLLKSEIMETSPDRLLIPSGRVAPEVLEEAVRTQEVRILPHILGLSLSEARETLATTKDPQKGDFVLDKAYFADALELALSTGSTFLTGYVRTLIDAANIKTIVRMQRMGKGLDAMESVLFEGGNADKGRIYSMMSSGAELEEIFSVSTMKLAAESGSAAARGAGLTDFEKQVDNAVNAYITNAKYQGFGDAPMVGYLAAREAEFTAVRIIMTGRLAGLPAEVIRERLRDAYG